MGKLARSLTCPDYQNSTVVGSGQRERERERERERRLLRNLCKAIKRGEDKERFLDGKRRRRREDEDEDAGRYLVERRKEGSRSIIVLLLQLQKRVPSEDRAEEEKGEKNCSLFFCPIPPPPPPFSSFHYISSPLSLPPFSSCVRGCFRSHASFQPASSSSSSLFLSSSPPSAISAYDPPKSSYMGKAAMKPRWGKKDCESCLRSWHR